jgi:hypothetical protein
MNADRGLQETGSLTAEFGREKAQKGAKTIGIKEGEAGVPFRAFLRLFAANPDWLQRCIGVHRRASAVSGLICKAD